MKTIFFFCFISILCFSSVSGQTIIRGVIKDAENLPIIGASVTCENQMVVTDSDGNYSISLFKTGENNLILSSIGYKTRTIPIRVAGDEIKVMDFTMEEENTILNTVTVTSGRFDRPLSEVTVSLDVVKPILLESNNSTSVDEVLQKVPGVNILDGQANIRGGSGFSYGAGSRVLLMVDDIPFLQPDAGTVNWDDIPVENVAQIEVLKGAASALYGSSAMNGIINIRTDVPTEKLQGKASVFFNNYLSPNDASQKWWDTPRYQSGGSIGLKGKTKKLDWTVGTFMLKRESFNENNNSNYFRIAPGIKYRITDRLTVGLNTNFNVGNSSSSFYWANDTSGVFRGAPGTLSENSRNRLMIDPTITYFDKKGGKHKFLGRMYLIRNKGINNTDNNSNLYYGEYQYQKNWKSFNFTSGVVGIGSTMSAPLYSNSSYSSTNFAVYLQPEVNITSKWILNFGARYESNSLKNDFTILQDKAVRSVSLLGTDTILASTVRDGKPVFRIGTNYQITPSTFFRASFGQAYRFPTVAEKFVFTSFGQGLVSPNPSLTSETGWTAEVGIKRGVKINNWDGFVDVSIFRSQYDNMMEFTFRQIAFLPTGIGAYFQSRNVGGTQIDGVEIGVGGAGKFYSVPVNIMGGFTWIDPTFRNQESLVNSQSSSTANVLKYRFRQTGKVDIEAFPGNFTIGSSLQYFSRMEAIDLVFESFISGLKQYRQREPDGVLILDIRGGYIFKLKNPKFGSAGKSDNSSKLRVNLILSNVTNRIYGFRPALLEAPRNFTVRMDYSF
jgi:outer membrane receptor protein involved in Fe transport